MISGPSFGGCKQAAMCLVIAILLNQKARRFRITGHPEANFFKLGAWSRVEVPHRGVEVYPTSRAGGSFAARLHQPSNEDIPARFHLDTQEVLL